VTKNTKIVGFEFPAPNWRSLMMKVEQIFDLQTERHLMNAK